MSKEHNKLIDAIYKSPILSGKAIKDIDLCYYDDIEDKGLNIIPTGFTEIDFDLLDIGGVPQGRIIDMWGKEGSGKSTIGLRIMSNAQKMGLPCLLLDIEQAYGDAPGKAWLKTNGVDLGPSGLLYSREVVAENVFMIAHAAIVELGVKVVMIDSVAAMIPRKESIEELGKSSATQKKANYDREGISGLAKILSRGLGQMNALLNKHDATLLCINQVRDYIGFNPSGIPMLSRPGGRAFKHYASVSLKMDRAGTIKEGKNIVGNFARITVEKCKVGPGFGRKTGVDTPNHVAIYYDGRKMNRIEAILPICVELGIVEKPTARSFAYGGVTATSKDKFIAGIEEAGLLDQLVAELDSSRGNKPTTVLAGDVEEFDAVDTDADSIFEEETP